MSRWLHTGRKLKSPGGTFLEKGDMDVRWTRPPFHAPQPFHKTPFLTKNHTKFSNFPLKIPKFGHFLCSQAKNRLKSSSESLNLTQKSVLRVSNLSKISSKQAPKFAADPLRVIGFFLVIFVIVSGARICRVWQAHGWVIRPVKSFVSGVGFPSTYCWILYQWFVRFSFPNGC